MIKGYFIISILLIVDLILYLTNGISISGQFSDKILFWIWLIMTPILIVKYFHKKLAKLYLGVIGFLIVLSLLPMGIPFLTIIAFAIVNDSEKKIENYKMREGAKSVIAIPKIRLIKNMGIIEKEVGETEFYVVFKEGSYRLEEIEEINLIEESDSLNFEFRIGDQRTNRKFKNE